MIEIINIFFLIFSMVWIYSFPLLQSNLKNNLVINKFTSLEKITVNLSIFLNFFLIFSFYKVNFQYIFIILLTLPLINFFFIRKKIILKDLIILLFFSFVLSISISSNLKLEWDGAAIWIYKTINFFQEMILLIYLKLVKQFHILIWVHIYGLFFGKIVLSMLSILDVFSIFSVSVYLFC